MREFRIECSLELPCAALWRVRGTRRFMRHLVAERALARMTASNTAVVRPAGPDGRPALLRRTFLYVPATIDIPDVVRSVFSDDYLELADECTWPADEAEAEASSSSCCTTTTSPASSADTPAADGPIAAAADDWGIGMQQEAKDKHDEENDDDERHAKKHLSQTFVITPGVLADYICTKGELSISPHPSGDPTRCLHVLAGTCNVSLPFVGYYIEEAIVANMQAFYDNYPAHIRSMRSVLLSDYATTPSPAPQCISTTAELLNAAARRVVEEDEKSDETTREPADLSADAGRLDSTLDAQTGDGDKSAQGRLSHAGDACVCSSQIDLMAGQVGLPPLEPIDHDSNSRERECCCRA
jgi:hypothetical protein